MSITIPVGERRRRYTASGGQTAFDFPFPVLAAADVKVWRSRAGVISALALSTDYTLAGVGSQPGVTLNLVAGATAGDVIAIDGLQPSARATDFADGARLDADDLDDEYNRHQISLQEVQRDTIRALRVHATDDETIDLTLPDKATRALKVLGFDATGKPIAQVAAAVGPAGPTGPQGPAGQDGLNGAGTGDVIAAANFTAANRLLRSSNTSKQIADTAATLDAAGNLGLPASVIASGRISPAQIVANTNDYAPTGFAAASVLRINSDAARDLTGLAGGADGRLVALINTGTFTITLKNESGSSTAANRFAFGADFSLLAGMGLWLWYDSTSSRWRRLGGLSRGVEVEAADANIVRGNVSSNLSRGYTATSFSLGTITSGTVTPDPANGNIQHYTANGAHTLAAPVAAGSYTLVIQVTNGASAGAITFSNFEKQTGDSYATTSGNDYLFFVYRINGFDYLHIQALQ